MNIYNLMLTMSGAAYSHAFVAQVSVGGQDEMMKEKDNTYPAVVFDFPIQGNINNHVKQYNLAFEVHDRIIQSNSNVVDKLIRAGKTENIAEDVYHLIRTAVNTAGYEMEEPNQINFLIDLPETSDINVMTRCEFVINQPRRNCDPIPTK